MRLPFVLLAVLSCIAGRGQELYFPPTQGAQWETVDPAALGWCTDQLPALYDHLASTNTKAFIVLKDGRIAIEQYFGSFTQDSVWYWASAGKSLTAFLVGLAQQEGHLNIGDATSDHLGNGWTNLSPEQEQAITIRHQLTMTTGLNDALAEPDCTDPACLQYLAAPGTRWAYHNAPYTLLDGVLENATGLSLNTFLFTRLTQTTGLTGLYVDVGYNNVFFSRARSMARFGLLMQADGNWNGNVIMSDPVYLQDMISPSQELNEAYGYLWWLNGTSSYMLPQTQFIFPGPAMPNAPADAYNALGKNGQIINISPSQGLVVVRMGNMPDVQVFVPNLYNDQIWQHLNPVLCVPVGEAPVAVAAPDLVLLDTPVGDRLRLQSGRATHVALLDITGRQVGRYRLAQGENELDLSGSATGTYLLFDLANGRMLRFMKQ